jgi:hypothetical protein
MATLEDLLAQSLGLPPIPGLIDTQSLGLSGVPGMPSGREPTKALSDLRAGAGAGQPGAVSPPSPPPSSGAAPFAGLGGVGIGPRPSATPSAPIAAPPPVAPVASPPAPSAGGGGLADVMARVFGTLSPSSASAETPQRRGTRENPFDGDVDGGKAQDGDFVMLGGRLMRRQGRSVVPADGGSPPPQQGEAGGTQTPPAPPPVAPPGRGKGTLQRTAPASGQAAGEVIRPPQPPPTPTGVTLADRAASDALLNAGALPTNDPRNTIQMGPGDPRRAGSELLTPPDADVPDLTRPDLASPTLAPPPGAPPPSGGPVTTTPPGVPPPTGGAGLIDALQQMYGSGRLMPASAPAPAPSSTGGPPPGEPPPAPPPPPQQAPSPSGWDAFRQMLAAALAGAAKADPRAPGFTAFAQGAAGASQHYRDLDDRDLRRRLQQSQEDRAGRADTRADRADTRAERADKRAEETHQLNAQRLERLLRQTQGGPLTPQQQLRIDQIAANLVSARQRGAHRPATDAELMAAFRQYREELIGPYRPTTTPPPPTSAPPPAPTPGTGGPPSRTPPPTPAPPPSTGGGGARTEARDPQWSARQIASARQALARITDPSQRATAAAEARRRLQAAGITPPDDLR